MADLDERPKFFVDLSRPSQRQVLRDMEEVVRKWRPGMYQSAQALLEHLSTDAPSRRSSKRFYHSPYVRALEGAAADCIPFPPLRPDAKDWGMQFWYNMVRLARLPSSNIEEIIGAIRGEVHLRAADVARCLEKFDRGANLPTPPEHSDYDFTSTFDGADAYSDISEESYVTRALDALDSVSTTDDVISVQSLEILEVRPLSGVDMDEYFGDSPVKRTTTRASIPSKGAYHRNVRSRSATVATGAGFYGTEVEFPTELCEDHNLGEADGEINIMRPQDINVPTDLTEQRTAAPMDKWQLVKRSSPPPLHEIFMDTDTRQQSTELPDASTPAEITIVHTRTPDPSTYEMSLLSRLQRIEEDQALEEQCERERIRYEAGLKTAAVQKELIRLRTEKVRRTGKLKRPGRRSHTATRWSFGDVYDVPQDTARDQRRKTTGTILTRSRAKAASSHTALNESAMDAAYAKSLNISLNVANPKWRP